MDGTERVRINVGGVSFQTTNQTLLSHPGTRLAELSDETDRIDTGNGQEYYFDRDPAVFACVLNFYRTKQLHVTQALCGNAVRIELDFWKISESVISPCCWRTLHQVDQDKDIMAALADVPTSPVNGNSCWLSFRHRVWTAMDQPDSSLAAKIWNTILTLMILLASTSYCLDTVAQLKTFPENGTLYYTYYEMFRLQTTSNREPVFLFGVANPLLELLDLVCLVFFSLELLVHLLVSPRLLRFFCSFYNIIDLLAVLIGWTVLIISYRFNEWFGQDVLTVLLVLKSIYVIRLFRVFRFMQTNSDLRIILLTLQRCKKELLLLLLSVLVIALIFASLAYFCENTNENFNSIPVSLWWAVVTMTTVGYGDVYPATTCGYVVGAVCAFLGVLSLSLPVAVIATHFGNFYCIHLWWRDRKRKLATKKV